jgi:tetratricopeptide (TPR) repeat protein
MHIKKNRTLIVASGIICLAIIILVIKFVIDLPYRSKLPDIPDLKGSSAPLKEQILNASLKAHRNPSADNIGKLGMIYHSSAYYDKAAQCYSLACKRNKSGWIWSYCLGYLNQEMGESNKSIENFRDVIKVNPANYHAWYYVGEGYRNLGENYKAEVAYQKIANLQEKSNPKKATTRNDYFPLRAYAMLQISRIYINSDRVDLAELTLKQILQFHRSFGPAYRFLASVYRLKGDSVQSKYNIVRANDLVDFTPPVDTIIDKLALISKSELYLLKQIDFAEKGFYPEWGLAIAKNGLKQLPENKYLISKAIKLFLRLDLGKQALPYLDKHINLYKEDFNEIKDVADLLYEKGFNSQSLIYYNQAAKLKPEDIEIQSSIVLCLWNGGMKQIASDQVTDFLEKHKESIDALTSGVSFFIKVGDRKNAIIYLDKLKHLSPDNPKVKKFSGMIAENDRKVPEAIAQYESSFNSDPSDLTTIRYLGNILIRNKMWGKAIKHYKRALDYYPNEPEILERLGTLLVSCPDTKMRDYKIGREYSERAFIHKSCPAEVLISAAKSLAEAYYGLGDNRNASTFMNIAISLAKNQNSSKDYIANLEEKLKLYSSSN